MNVGILGGTFDPVHIAHLLIAEEAMRRLRLGKVLFVPAGRPWMKRGRRITAAEHRVAMLRLALKAHPRFEISLAEVERPGPSYTVDTLVFLRQDLDFGHRFFLILGKDSLADLPRWHEPQRLAALCRFAAFPRRGCQEVDLGSLERAIPGVSKRILMLEGPVLEISATEIRQRVRLGKSIRYLVPEPVETYIREHRLYGKG